VAERKRDLGVFMVPVVGLVITAGALLTIDESDPPVLTGARLLMAAVAAVMTVGSFGFALRWNQPTPPRPKPAAKPRPSPNASNAVSASDGETTWGTGGIGGDSAVDTRHLGDHGGMSHASASSDAGGSWDYGGSDVGSDSGGGDSGGGDSGGSSS
jgi:uncharacterized membrane protein YgcG